MSDVERTRAQDIARKQHKHLTRGELMLLIFSVLCSFVKAIIAFLAYQHLKTALGLPDVAFLDFIAVLLFVSMFKGMDYADIKSYQQMPTAERIEIVLMSVFVAFVMMCLIVAIV